jgi:hypothetical protein
MPAHSLAICPRRLAIFSSLGIPHLSAYWLTIEPGTALAGCLPPAPEEFGAFFARARRCFPRTPVVLGCERPLGRHRRETERLALEAGLDGMAFPLEKTLAQAAALNLKTGFLENCCALIA